MKRSVRWASVVVLMACAACDSGGASSGSVSATPEPKGSGSAKAATSSAASAKPSAATASSGTPASSAKPSDDKADGVALGRHYAAVGDKETSNTTEVVTLKGKVKGKGGEEEVEVVTTTTTEKVEECLEVKDQSCTKLKVTFSKNERHTVANGKAKDEKKATEGKTFVITATATGRDITHEDGGKPTAEELDDLKSKYKRLGRDKELMDALPTSVKVGDSLDAAAKKLAEAASDSDDDSSLPKVEASLKVKEIRDEGGKKVIVLDVHLSLEGTSPKAGHVKSDTTGTVLLDAATGRGTSVEFAGPMEVDLPKEMGLMKGTMTHKASSTFSH